MNNSEVNLRKLLKQEVLKNELELEQARILNRKLKRMTAKFPALKEDQQQLGAMIKAYEYKYWTNEDQITDKQVIESDLAEYIAEQEQLFFYNRKNTIKTKLKAYNLTQQELGIILGHNSKSYISELMNGISPFAMKDIVIIHKIFNIEFDVLIPSVLSQQETVKLQSNLMKINNPKLKLQITDLYLKSL